MIEPIKKLDLHYDPQQLWCACLALVGAYGWGDSNQICLTHRPEITDPTERVFEGAGRSMRKERDFSALNAMCRDTYIEQVLKTLPYQIGRIRLMRMLPRTCYSVHRDYSMRLHLPLVTNSAAYMIFPDQSLIQHLPATGHVYLTDTTLRHSAMNGGETDRLSLVGALCE